MGRGDKRETRDPADAPPATPPRAADRPAGAASPQPTRPIARPGQSPLSTADDVAAFVDRLKSMPTAQTARGRLVFAMDATMSRQPTWDMALALQGEMFDAVRRVGSLDVQLVYFRGHGECRASRWVGDPGELARLMTAVDCRGGHTQIGKVLAHARQECERQRISALVHVGDAMEEGADELCERAGELALLGVPVFLFQEGADEMAERTFREIARITRGAWCRFDSGAADQLKELLTAVAVYAAGGRQALLQLASQSRGGRRGAQLLLGEMKR